MRRILIADSNKASLVMTSEAMKDHYPGVQVIVAKSGAEALQLAQKTEHVDAYIIDFDLPDTNGAQVALQLKALSNTPILITSFDHEEAIHTIETLLDKYDDCKSWLKKPIRADVLIAVVQRYCEGKIRMQKRIPCTVPAYVQLQGQTKSAKPLTFFAMVEDCSLNGAKLKPVQNADQPLPAWKKLLQNFEKVTANSSIVVSVTPFDDIEAFKPQELEATLKKKLAHQSGTPLVALEGRVAWINPNSGEWFMGIEFSGQSVSKRLFEAVVAAQSRFGKGSFLQGSAKSPRLF